MLSCSAPNEPEDEDDDRNHKQYVKEATNMPDEKAKQPQNYENRDNRF